MNYLDGIKIEETLVFEIEYGDFEKLVQRVYGQNYEFADDMECSNDSVHRFSVKEEPLSRFVWGEEDIDKFTKTGKSSFIGHVLLQDMCNKKIIQPGKYLIYVCW